MPGEVEKVTNELSDNSAHRLRRLLFCKRTAIISACEGTPLQTQRIAPMPCSFAARMAANRSCFHLRCLTPNKGILLYLIRNKVDY